MIYSRVPLIALAANLLLVVVKFTAGHLGDSRALIADGYHSGGDVVTTLVAWLAFRYGSAPPDREHPYGHANAESLAGLLIGAMISITGVFIIVQGIDGWLVDQDLPEPGTLALWGAGVTVVIKLVLYLVSARAAQRLNSPTLDASASDHRADATAGFVALIGIAIARQGLPWVDLLTAILIGAYVFLLGFGPMRANLDVLMQREPEGAAERVGKIAAEHPSVRGVGAVRVQPIGGSWRADLELRVDPALSVGEAHRIADEVELRIVEAVERVLEVVVHIEPADAPVETSSQ